MNLRWSRIFCQGSENRLIFFFINVTTGYFPLEEDSSEMPYTNKISVFETELQQSKCHWKCSNLQFNYMSLIFSFFLSIFFVWITNPRLPNLCTALSIKRQNNAKSINIKITYLKFGVFTNPIRWLSQYLKDERLQRKRVNSINETIELNCQLFFYCKFHSILRYCFSSSSLYVSIFLLIWNYYGFLL